jgi:sRNA-binding protein
LEQVVEITRCAQMGPAYCQAVLKYDCRIGLDGTQAEAVETEARDQAAKQLAALTARKAEKAAAKTMAPPAGKPKPAPTPPAETPEQLRARVRASLLRRSA